MECERKNRKSGVSPVLYLFIPSPGLFKKEEGDEERAREPVNKSPRGA